MTALDRYALLEAEAVYFDGESARPHDVIIRFGEATLTVLDLQDRPMEHWALASLRKVSSTRDEHGREVLRVSPGHESEERLTLTDPSMIDAIRQVCPDLEAGPKVGAARIGRRIGMIGAAIGVLAGMVFFLAPLAAERLAASVPQERAERVGDAVVGVAARSMGAAGEDALCRAPGGQAALDRLTARLREGAPDAPPLRVMVLRGPALNAVTLPGGRILMFSALLDFAQTPEQFAAILAHEIAHAEARDPLRETFRSVGAGVVMSLVVGDYAGGAATSAVAQQAVGGAYRQEAESAADDRALEILAAAGLPSAALAEMFERLEAERGAPRISHLATHPDLSGRAAKARAADVIGDAPFRPALQDEGWLALQQICD
ncbi:M48 family metallopeptidase [Rhodovulum sp. DZ06]|uniref:M48 family metallopeptidase n=1 Tax=Rhodovulum sp. DZ06 TaxID=3425126 RepID=UPI003D334796